MWRSTEALAGRCPDKVRDKAGEIGTICHAMIEEDLSGAIFDRSDYAPMGVATAENAFIAYMNWENE
jgi:ATP-dependent exoDNAse (exonuclease V) beta subunit